MLARAVAEECVRIPEERKHIADEGRQHDPEIHLKVGGKERSWLFTAAAGSCSFPTDSSQFPTEEILGA